MNRRGAEAQRKARAHFLKRGESARLEREQVLTADCADSTDKAGNCMISNLRSSAKSAVKPLRLFRRIETQTSPHLAELSTH